MNVRRLLLLSAVACLLLAGCASGARHAASDAKATAGNATDVAASGTDVRTFHAYDASGHLTAPVGKRVSGHCWEASLAAPAAGAYRCLAANTILDPCFARAGGKQPSSVACFTDPWAKATVMTLRRHLPRVAPLTARSWAVVLSTGARCVAATGTAPFVKGVGLGYSCDDGTAVALRDVGSPHVRALVGRDGGHRLTRVAVSTLWRG